MLANSSLVTTSAAGPVVHARRVAGGRRALGVEDRLQAGELLERGVAARPLVDGKVADRHELGVEEPLVDRLDRALVRAQRPPVLLLARDAELAGDEGRLLDHVLVVEGRGEPVVDHQVDQRAVAEPVAEARLLQRVRRVRHRLHPARDDDLHVTGADHLVGDLDRADRRGADLVDRVRGQLDRQPGSDRRLARRRLARAALQHLAHDRVLDLLVLDAGAVERGPDRDRAELGRLVPGERAAEPPEGRAHSRDDHGARHRRQGNFAASCGAWAAGAATSTGSPRERAARAGRVAARRA